MNMTPDVETVLFNSAANPSALSRFKHVALNILFPAHCTACHKPVDPPTNTILCLDCANRINWIGPDRCRRCGDLTGAGSGVMSDCISCRSHPPVYIESTSCVGKFAKESPLRALVLSLKFGRKTHLAKPLGELLAKRVRSTQSWEPQQKLILVPVPVTKENLRQSGWNHAEEIATCAANLLSASVEPRLIRKIRATPPQATLKRMERRKNLKDAFACDEKIAKKCVGATILLIDDVITTGTTISECARTLHAAGFASIFAASIART